MARGARGAANERTSEGLVLRCVDYAEADRVCTVLLREEGKRSFFAKGARSRTKRFRGGLGAFSLLKLRWVDKGEAKLAGLRESDVTTAYHGISQDLPKLAAGSWALELVEAMLEEHRAQARPSRPLRASSPGWMASAVRPRGWRRGFTALR